MLLLLIFNLLLPILIGFLIFSKLPQLLPWFVGINIVLAVVAIVYHLLQSSAT